MAYTGSVDLISGIRPKNNGAFPLVDAKDVYVTDDKRLDAALNDKAGAADVIQKPAVEGTEGQHLEIGANGDPVWLNPGTPTDTQVGEAVDAWLTAHPEATTTVQDGTITRAKLDDDLKEKTDAVPELKSALNSINNNGYANLPFSTDNVPGYLNFANGAQVANAASQAVCTDYVDVSLFVRIKYKRTLHTGSNPQAGMAFYDAEKTFIPNSGTPGLGDQPEMGYAPELYERTVPANACYARFTFLADSEEYGAFEVDGYAGINSKIAALEEVTSKFITSVRFDDVTEYDSVYIGPNGSVISGGANWITTKAIPCSEGQTVEAYTRLSANVLGIIFYDEDNTFMFGVYSDQTGVMGLLSAKAPHGAAYAKFTFTIDRTYDTVAQWYAVYVEPFSIEDAERKITGDLNNPDTRFFPEYYAIPRYAWSYNHGGVLPDATYITYVIPVDASASYSFFGFAGLDFNDYGISPNGCGAFSDMPFSASTYVGKVTYTYSDGAVVLSIPPGAKYIAPFFNASFDLSADGVKSPSVKGDIARLDGIVAAVEDETNSLNTVVKSALSGEFVSLPFTTDGVHGFLNYSNGAQVPNSASAAVCTDFVDVSLFGRIKYRRTLHTGTNPMAGMAFYDKDELFISGSGTPGIGDQPEMGYAPDLYERAVPANACYARFTFWADSQTYGEFVIEGAAGRADNSLAYFNGKKLGMLGDSISYGQYAAKSYSQIVAEALGMDCYNVSVPGYTLEQIYGKIDDLPASLDYVFLMGGTNNYKQTGIQGTIGEFYTTTDGVRSLTTDQTISGVLNRILTKLRDKYPTAMIILLTPPKSVRWIQPSDNPTNPFDMFDLVNAYYKASLIHSCPVFNVCGECILDSHNDTQAEIYYTHIWEAGSSYPGERDTSHPTTEGQKVLANYVISKLVELGKSVNGWTN